MVKRQTQTADGAASQKILTIDDIRRTFEALPEKQKSLADLPRLDLMAQLKPTITGARSKGYSWTEIHKLLTEMGVKISEVTLKAYVMEDRRAKRASKAQ